MTKSQDFLPYGRQSIDEDDIAAVADVLRSTMLTTGPKVQEFEAALAKVTGAKHAIVCNSGTAALHLSLLALGVTFGDLVIVPAISFVATANAVRMTGADVVFADVDPDTGLMTAETLKLACEKVDKSLVKAIIAVHLTGQCEDLSLLKGVAESIDAVLIADACHALGGQYHFEAGKQGAIGDCQFELMSCFSFHPVKAIAMGEGGAVTTNDDQLAELMRSFLSHGVERDAESFANKAMAFDGDTLNPWYHEFQRLGYNYRAPDILCALGESQLSKLPAFLKRREEIAKAYDAAFKELSPLLRPVKRLVNCSSGWHLYSVLIDFAGLGLSRQHVITSLRQKGIGSQVHYIPIHQQPYYEKLYGAQILPGAERYYQSTLSLPFYQSLCDDDVVRVIEAVTSIIKQA